MSAKMPTPKTAFKVGAAVLIAIVAFAWIRNYYERVSNRPPEVERARLPKASPTGKEGIFVVTEQPYDASDPSRVVRVRASEGENIFFASVDGPIPDCETIVNDRYLFFIPFDEKLDDQIRRTNPSQSKDGLKNVQVTRMGWRLKNKRDPDQYPRIAFIVVRGKVPPAGWYDEVTKKYL